MEDQTGDVPLALNKKLAEAGILSTRVGPGKHLEGYPIIGGVSPHEFDYFHELIACEEGARLGCHGFMTGVFGGLTIGLPPVFKFSNSPALTKRVCDEVFRGDKRIALAISEPDAGSDVAGLKTTAVKSADGKYYIVNGMKKWITGGAVADYFTTAVRTSKTGLSMLLIERGPGVTTQKIATSYSPMAGTAYVFFKDVKVPVENLLGKEGNGFACVVANFNHERWSMICGNLANSRLVLEESFKWANQRKVFGKNLLNQAVIRAKLAEMMAEVEACHNWLENITYQMNLMSAKDINEHLAGPIALLKYKTTRVAYLVNDHAIQIFGGRAITKKGMGAFIERNQRAVKFDAILGGSEEIMADLGVRQAMKQFPANARLWARSRQRCFSFEGLTVFLIKNNQQHSGQTGYIVDLPLIVNCE